MRSRPPRLKQRQRKQRRLRLPPRATARSKCVTCLFRGFSVGVANPERRGASSGPTASPSPTMTRAFTSAADTASSPGRPEGPSRDLPPGDRQRGARLRRPRSGAVSATTNTSSVSSADGSTLLFSSEQPVFNPLGGVTENGGDAPVLPLRGLRSLARLRLLPAGRLAPPNGAGPLCAPLSRHRSAPTTSATSPWTASTFAFVTATPLLDADQNSPGPGQNPHTGGDVYEWRNGQPALVTDGLIELDRGPRRRRTDQPTIEGVTPSGSDIFFAASAAYTPDAPDTLHRLYTARIGGGIDFPEDLPPCDLNSGACEGPGTSPPNLPGAGAAAFEGPQQPARDLPRDARRLPRAPRKLAARGREAPRAAARPQRRARRKHEQHPQRSAQAPPGGGIANRRAARSSRPRRLALIAGALLVALAAPAGAGAAPILNLDLHHNPTHLVPGGRGSPSRLDRDRRRPSLDR